MNVKRYDYTPYTGSCEVKVDGEPLARAEWFVLESDYDSLLAAAREAEKALSDASCNHSDMCEAPWDDDKCTCGAGPTRKRFAAALARLREYTA